MREGLLVSVIAMATMAACSAPSGMRVGVHAMVADVDEVELFIGTAPSTSCGSGCVIGPESGGRFAATGFETKSTTSNLVSLDGKGDTTVWFEIDQDVMGSASTIPALAIVESKNGTPVHVFQDDDVEFTPGTEREFLLDDVVPLAKQAQDGQRRAEVWRRFGDTDRSKSACLVVQRANHHLEFIVPADDPDCDGATDCPSTALQWCAQEPGQSAMVDSQKADCLVTDESSGACRFGVTVASGCVDVGPACNQAQPAGTVCVETTDQACVAQSLCDPTTCPAWGDACEPASQSALPAPLRLVCVLAVSVDGSTNKVTDCNGPTQYDVTNDPAAKLLFDPMGDPTQACSTVFLDTFDHPQAIQANQVINNGTSIDLSVDGGDNGCSSAKLISGGKAPPGAQVPAHFQGSFGVQLDNATLRWIPVDYTFVACDSATPAGCSIVPSGDITTSTDPFICP